MVTTQGSGNAGSTGVPRSEEAAPTQDPSVGLCLGPCGGPREVGCEVPLFTQTTDIHREGRQPLHLTPLFRVKAKFLGFRV